VAVNPATVASPAQVQAILAEVSRIRPWQAAVAGMPINMIVVSGTCLSQHAWHAAGVIAEDDDAHPVLGEDVGVSWVSESGQRWLRVILAGR
jgi:hypothetical protein